MQSALILTHYPTKDNNMNNTNYNNGAQYPAGTQYPDAPPQYPDGGQHLAADEYPADVKYPDGQHPSAGQQPNAGQYTDNAQSSNMAPQEMPPMTVLNMFYTTSRLNATLHEGDASTPALYYLESSILARKPSLFLRKGGKKSSPMVSFVKASWALRHMMVGRGDCKKDTDWEQKVDKVMREKGVWHRSDYKVTILGDSAQGEPPETTLILRKDMSHTFKTVYTCVDEHNNVLGYLHSGGMLNWKKGGEIGVANGLTETQKELFLAAAGGVWGLEALNYRSIGRGFEK